MNTDFAVEIVPEMTVNEIIAAYPNTVRIFHTTGIDACCGGALSLSTVAERHRLDLTELLRALRGIATEG
jgi:iron-sulfur cluster repair protein YtfE (RIC family)